MRAVKTIGLDIAKSIFQVHGVDADGQVVFRRQLKRRNVLAFFQKVPSCLVGMEALVNGAKILVMRLRQIARGCHQAEWVHGNGGGLADGRFNWGATRVDARSSA